MSDLISRQDAIKELRDVIVKDVQFGDELTEGYNDGIDMAITVISKLPSAQPERLIDDDFETIRIHLSAYKEKLCNQQRWKEAEEYQRIIDRFMEFASAQPEPYREGYWIYLDNDELRYDSYRCSNCNRSITVDDERKDDIGFIIEDMRYCPCCGTKMVEVRS